MRSCNHRYSGNATLITCSDCIYVALVIQHVTRVRHIVMWPAQLYNIFSPFLINGMIAERKIIEHTTCVLIFSTTFACSISHSKMN